jgi:hypothetical protein
MRWYRHGYKNACKLAPVPKFPSFRVRDFPGIFDFFRFVRYRECV